MDTVDLKEWIETNNIEQKTIQGFWKYVNNRKKELDDDTADVLNFIELNNIRLEIKKASLSVIYNYGDFVSLLIDIYFKEHYIGSYESIFTLSGEYADDFLKIDDIDYLWRLAFVEERNIEIARAALEEGLDLEKIAKITELSIEKVKELQENIHQYKNNIAY
ncbi:MAG: hypothetical protein N3B21_19165 [Clostridia bacterium]|nr:hypothetical protein [Clostridia bacterium]